MARALQKLTDCDLDVDTIITDRHPQIAKYIRTEHQDITHLYDIWHVAKCNYQKTGSWFLMHEYTR